MSAEDIEKKKDEKVTGNTEAFSINELLRRVWAAKYWVLLSVVLCLGLSYLYYKRQAKSYGSSAEIMLLFGDEESAAASSALKAVTDISGMGRRDVNFSNELEIMRSPSLIESVIDRLNLATNYTTEGFGHKVDLYGESPVLVNFLDVEPDSTASLRLYKRGTGELIATDFVSNGKRLQSKPLRIEPGTVVNTPVGILAISPTADFDKFPEYVDVNKASVKNMATTISQNIVTTKKSNDTTVALISYTDVSQQRAIDVVNALIDAYNALWIAEQTRSAANTSNFINERLSVIEKELNGIDSDISQVKSSAQVADFAAAASTYYGQSMQYDSRAFEASTQLSIAQYLRDYINNKANNNALIPANTGATGTVESQIQEYNKMLARRDQLLQNSTEANPVIAQLNSDLAANRALINASLNNIISTYKIEADRASGRGREFSGKVSSVPEKEKQILSIERQQKVKENLYLYLLQKREENELTRMVQVNNTRVIRAAYGTGPTVAALTNSLLVGLLIGLAIPVLIIFLSIQLNTTVSRKSDLAGLSIPFLGEMPMNQGRRSLKRFFRHLFHPRSRTVTDKEIKLVVREHSRSYINEAFRMLRTNLDFLSSSERGCEVIMLTSFNPGSGKTFISVNLAKSLVLKGKKVLLIDLDLRRASLSLFGGNAAQGVSTYLTGKSGDIMGLIKMNNRGTGIDLLPVGAIPPNPVELLLSHRFNDMVTKLRQHYNYIVIDCPPYELVADTQIIGRVVDVTLFVIRARLFRKSLLPDLEKIYQEHKLNNLAIILNGINPQDSYYHNRYGYDHGSTKSYYLMYDEADAKSLEEDKEEETDDRIY